MDNDEGKIETIAVAFTSDEVKFIIECVLGCPLQTDVRSMPKVLGMAQGILKKLTPITPGEYTRRGELGG